jgi:alanine racemase
VSSADFRATESTDRPARPAWVGIDLNALARNLERLSRWVAPAAVLAVVKADAYGHGAIAVSHRLAAEGVEALAVAFAAEGVAIRKAGIATPILVLGPTHRTEPATYRDHRLTPTVSDLDQLAEWAGWCDAHDVSQELHLKVDTGMTRLGLHLDELPRALESIRASDQLRLVGLMSHLAEADEPASAANAVQARRFDDAVRLLTDDERRRVTIHLANSAGALHSAGLRHRMVRAGLALYGIDPVAGNSTPIELEAVMTVEASVVSLRDVATGTAVGYGGTWTTARDSRLALVPVGYADGYPWRLSNRGEVLIRGRRAPVAGRVSMDMLVADVTDVPAAVGDAVVLLGEQDGERIDAWELATAAGTIPWETLCLFGRRLPRRYAGRATSPAPGR